MRGLRHRLPPDVLLLVTVVIWSFNITAVKYALTHGFEPLAFSASRYAVAALLFAAVTYGRESRFTFGREDLGLLVVAAVVGVWLNQLAFVYALRLTTAATVALLFGTLPVFVALFARAFGLERLRVRQLVAAVVSFSGVALVALGASGGIRGGLGGVLLALATAGTWAGYSVAIGPLMQRYSPYRISTLVLGVGSVPLVVSASTQLAAQDWGEPGAIAWAALLYALVFSLVVTNVLWFTAIDRVGAARSSLYANLQPFLGAVFALVILGEQMGTLQVAGGFVIAAGIMLARAARTRPVTT